MQLLHFNPEVSDRKIEAPAAQVPAGHRCPQESHGHGHRGHKVIAVTSRKRNSCIALFLQVPAFPVKICAYFQMLLGPHCNFFYESNL